MDNPQVIVVGSGPAGVSVAFPLVEAGVRVLMLDVGRDGASTGGMDPNKNLGEVRRSAGQWDMMIGETGDGVQESSAPSPKFRIPAHRYVFAGFRSRLNIDTKNFTAIGSLAKGGLSNAWGAGVSLFDDDDLAEFPISLADLLDSYRKISQRIGVAGSNDDHLSDIHGGDRALTPPIRPVGNVARLYERYLAKPQRAWAHDVRIGHARNATLTEDRSGRKGCVYCGRCLWGCEHGAIYTSAFDLDRLSSQRTFRYVSGVLVTRLVKIDDGWRIVGEKEGTRREVRFDASRVVLAAGAIGSSKIVLQALALYDKSIPIQTNPVAAFALLTPQPKPMRLMDEDVFALAQLSFHVSPAGPPSLPKHAGYAYGNLFAADTLPASEYFRRLPFSYPLSRSVVRLTQPQLVVGNCYWAGSFSRNRLSLDETGRVTIAGGYADSLDDMVKATARRLARAMRRYGALMAPRTLRVQAPGADAHYGATTPMRRTPEIGETDPQGEVAGLPGVFVADGGSLSALPPKPPTLTVMANADRIGAELSRRLHRSGRTAP